MERMARSEAAAAFLTMGFDGIRYYCGHDPSQREVGVALFVGASQAGLPVIDSTPISDDVVRVVERRLGVHVLPAP